MPETPDIRQFDNGQFDTWAEDAARIWHADAGKPGAGHSIGDIFAIMDETYRGYGLYVQDRLVAMAGISYSIFAREDTDRYIDSLAALPGPEAIGQKSALLHRAEDDAFNDRYSTMTALCTKYDLFSFYQERGYKVFSDEDGLIQVYKTLTRGNVTPIRFGER